MPRGRLFLMVGKAKRATAAQKQRMANIKVLGCMCCLLEGVTDRLATVHHIVEGRKRLGHDFTLGLCAWHHQAIEGYSNKAMTEIWGPSLANGSKPFVKRYGTELQLLKLQDFVLLAFEEMGWADYTMPLYMVAQAREFWNMETKS